VRLRLVVTRTPEDACTSLAQAFAEAADAGVEQLPYVLAEREGELDLETVRLALRCLVGVAARSAGTTPRELLALELAAAPPDEWALAAASAEGPGQGCRSPAPAQGPPGRSLSPGRPVVGSGEGGRPPHFQRPAV
jgi:hypothetical protein